MFLWGIDWLSAKIPSLERRFMSSLIDDGLLKEALHATIAKQILDGLGSEHRDALLQKSLVEVVRDYGFRGAIDKVACEKAAAVAKELMDTQEWNARISQAISDGFEDYLLLLREAIPDVMKKAIHGREGQYGSCGSVLGCWPKVKS